MHMHTQTIRLIKRIIIMLEFVTRRAIVIIV
jgi:hypothetical protein